MAGGVHVEVRGYAELAAGTRSLVKNIDGASVESFLRVAEQAATDVSGRVPRLTGALASSARAVTDGKGAKVEMGEGVEYARFVEYGGRGHPHGSPGNYLTPVALAAEPLLVAAAERTAEQQIGATHWPNP